MAASSGGISSASSVEYGHHAPSTNPVVLPTGFISNRRSPVLDWDVVVSESTSVPVITGTPVPGPAGPGLEMTSRTTPTRPPACEMLSTPPKLTPWGGIHRIGVRMTRVYPGRRSAAGRPAGTGSPPPGRLRPWPTPLYPLTATVTPPAGRATPD